MTPKQLMQADEWTAQFQERLSALEQENIRLRTELQVCHQRSSLFTQARVAELERANALLQAELAEEAKLAANATEQEKAAQERAAELAQANAVLRGATNRLAEEPSLEAFLRHVLAEACQEAIEAGAIMLYDDNREQLLPVVSYGFSADYPYSAQRPIPAVELPAWSTLLHTKQPLVVDIDT